jgi:hypothetical protein
MAVGATPRGCPDKGQAQGPAPTGRGGHGWPGAALYTCLATLYNRDHKL